MARITLEIDTNADSREVVEALSNWVEAMPLGLSGAVKPQVKPVKPAKQETFEQTKFDEKPAEAKEPSAETPKQKAPKISLADVRAVALKLSKAGKQAELAAMFAKYGAKNLTAVAESDWPALMADLSEAANG